MAISKGAVYLSSAMGEERAVAVATLWFGDVVGRGSPLGGTIAAYDVKALVDVETVVLPVLGPRAGAPEDLIHLSTATSARLRRQMAVRCGGNGPQRLVGALATLGSAMFQGPVRLQRANSVVIPVGQELLGELACLSPSAVRDYVRQLEDAGWLQTSGENVVLKSLPAWLAIPGQVDVRGLDCISTIESAGETLQLLGGTGTDSK